MDTIRYCDFIIISRYFSVNVLLDSILTASIIKRNIACFDSIKAISAMILYNLSVQNIF